MSNISLDNFKQVAGTSVSIGYVTTDAKGALQKTAAHRHLTSLNVKPQASATDKYIRTTLYNTIRQAVVRNGEVGPQQRAFLLATAKKLGIEFKGDGVEIDRDTIVSNQPLDRRTLRAVLHQTDVRLAQDKVDSDNAAHPEAEKRACRLCEKTELSKAESKIADSLNPKSAAFKKLSADERRSILEALNRLKTGGLYVSAEAVVGGKTVWFSQTTGSAVSVEFASGKALALSGSDALGDALVDKILENPAKEKYETLKAVFDRLEVSPFALRGPLAARVRGAAQKTLLALAAPGTKLGGEKGLKENALLAVSPQNMRKLVLEVLEGRIRSADRLNARLSALETKDLINSEEILKLAEDFEAADAEEQEQVKTLAAAPQKKPVGGFASVFGLFTGLFAKKPEPPKISAEDVKKMMADIIHDENTIELDRRNGKPGAQLAYSLGKHADTLAYLVCNPDCDALKELPDEYRSAIKTVLAEAAKADQLKGTAKPGNEATVKKLLDVALSTGALDGKLADVARDINGQTKTLFTRLQAVVKHSFSAMLQGKPVDMEGFGKTLDDEVETLRPTKEWASEAELVDFAADVADEIDAVLAKNATEAPDGPKMTREQARAVAVENVNARRAAAEVKAEAGKLPLEEIVRKTGYKNLPEMMRAAGMDPALVREAETAPVEPQKTKMFHGEIRANLDYDAEMEAHKKAMTAWKARRLELSRETLMKLCQDAAVDLDTGYGAFMLKAMNTYFKDMPVDDQRNMLAAGLRYAPSKAQMEKDGVNEGVAMLGATLKGAGPIMQKMLQGLASTNCDPAFKAALKDMKSKLAPIPDNVVKANLFDMVRRSNGAIEKIEVTKSLGAASVGQAFFCTVTLAEKDKTTGKNITKDVVVKMLRPDAEQRAKRETEIFRRAAAQVNGMSVTFEGQLASIMDELDLRIEAENTKAGKVYDSGASDVKSAKILDLIPPTRYTLVQERAPGLTVDELFDKMKEEMASATKPFFEEVPVRDENGDPVLDEKTKQPKTTFKLRTTLPGKNIGENLTLIAEAYKKLSELYGTSLLQQRRLVTLAEKWCTQGIYDSGFYHGDLHAGNIMVDDHFKKDEKGDIVVDPKTGLPTLEENGGLTVIDFGNATKLTSDQQKAVVQMMSAAAVKDTNRFMAGFRALMTPEGQKAFDKVENLIHDKIHNVLNLGTSGDSGVRIAAILQEMQKMGFELPGPIFKFSQCQMRLQGTIDEMNAMLENIQKTMTEFRKIDGYSLGKKDPTNTNEEVYLSALDPSFYAIFNICSQTRKELGNPSQIFDSERRKAEKYIRWRDHGEPQPGPEPDPKKMPEAHKAWKKRANAFIAYLEWKQEITRKNAPVDAAPYVKLRVESGGLDKFTIKTAVVGIFSGVINIGEHRDRKVDLIENSVRDLAAEFDDKEIVDLFLASRDKANEVLAPVREKTDEIDARRKKWASEETRLHALQINYSTYVEHVRKQEIFDEAYRAKVNELIGAKTLALGNAPDAAERLEEYKKAGGGLEKDLKKWCDTLDYDFTSAQQDKNFASLRDAEGYMLVWKNSIDRITEDKEKPGLSDEVKAQFEKDLKKYQDLYDARKKEYDELKVAFEAKHPGLLEDPLFKIHVNIVGHPFTHMHNGGKDLFKDMDKARAVVSDVEKKYGGLQQLKAHADEARGHGWDVSKELDDYIATQSKAGGPIDESCKAVEAFAKRYEELMVRRLAKYDDAFKKYSSEGKARKTETFFDAIGTVIGQNMFSSLFKIGLVGGLVTHIKSKKDQAPV